MVQSFMKKYYVMFFVIIVSLSLSSIGLAADYFDWDTRTDRDGMPAGHFDTTPFPIDENTTSYSITNDEGTKTYNLGTKYYVDGKDGSDSNDGLSLATAKKTIRAAISVAGHGNKTIIIRGAHDGWDGIYYEGTTVRPNYGVSDTQRFMLVGYKQERPILDGQNSTFGIMRTWLNQTNAYVTVQRLKLQNSKRDGFRCGDYRPSNMDAYTNLIDVWVYNCDNDPATAASADGNIYFMGVDYGWIYHCTSEHTYGHGIKYADNGSNGIIEWSVVKECRYWAGIPNPINVANDAYGLHISNVSGHLGENHKIRYNIVHDTAWMCMQLRRTPNFSVHHNEFYNGSKLYSFGVPASNIPVQCYMVYEDTNGDFYSNIVRNSETANANIELLRIRLVNDGTSTINIFSNLFYGSDYAAIHVRNDNTGATINMYNNTLYADSSGTIIDNDMGSSISITNNILYQAGSGTTAQIGSANHTYNLYYYPNGSRGDIASLGTGEIEGDPQFAAIPSGAYSTDEGNTTNTSSAKDAGTSMLPSGGSTISFNGATRPQDSMWDIGAYEYVSAVAPSPSAPSPPQNLMVIGN